MRHKETGVITYDMKMRGIKQTVAVERLLSYEEFKRMVDDYPNAKPKALPQYRFMPRLACGDVLTKDVEKDYIVMNPKAIIDDLSIDMDCYPYGY